jgi:hypothetical protein
MSYDIDRCIPQAVTDLHITGKNLEKLYTVVDFEDLPEYNFLQSFPVPYIDEDENPAEHPDYGFDEVWDPEAIYPIECLDWAYSGSGRSFDDILLEKIVPFLSGVGEFVYVWEGGDHMSGLKIHDGTYTRCKVKFVLEEIS